MAIDAIKIRTGTTGTTMRTGDLGHNQLRWCRERLPFFAVCERDARRAQLHREFAAAAAHAAQPDVVVQFPDSQPPMLPPFLNDPGRAGSLY